MGRGKRAGKQEKQNNIVRTVWKSTERSVKRNELDIIASICGTTRDITGEVQRRVTSTNNEYDDGAAATDERASESTPVDSDTSSTTV
jgi:hypothetical protein